MRRLPPQSHWWTPIITTTSLVCCLLVYYGIPIAPEADDAPGVVGAVLFGVGLAALLVVLAIQVRRQVRAGHELSVRVQSIFGLLSPVIVFFALTYYLIEFRDPTQFEGLATRTDALYFTVVTLGTVGYGDIHPTGDVGKIVAMVQIVFDLVIVGVLVAVTTSRARQRAELRASQH